MKEYLKFKEDCVNKEMEFQKMQVDMETKQNEIKSKEKYVATLENNIIRREKDILEEEKDLSLQRADLNQKIMGLEVREAEFAKTKLYFEQIEVSIFLYYILK